VSASDKRVRGSQIKKIGIVSSLLKWKASLALIDKDLGGHGAQFARGRSDEG